MKEKFKKWLAEGKVSLALFWFNVLMMVGVTIRGLIAGDYVAVLCGFLVFLPWVIVFGIDYEHVRFKKKALDFIVEQGESIDILCGFVKRYHKLYEGLPAEEKKEEQSKEEDHGKEN